MIDTYLKFVVKSVRMKSTVDQLGTRCHECIDKSCATALLDDREIDLIYHNRHIIEVNKRTNILSEASQVSHIIYLKSGLVKEYRIRPDNQEQILQIIKPHSYLGMTSIFGDRINQYSYEALTDLKLCYIDSDTFISLVRNNGNFAFEILKSVERDSLNNFHRFINLNHKKIYGRVADILIYFSKIIFSSNKLQIPLTRIELAEMCGTSRESIGRVIAIFKSDGIIKISGKNIIINDIKKLENISKFS
jgi:CRP-like cAMP-binding protein